MDLSKFNKYIFAILLVVGMHFYFPNIGGIGLYLPYNLMVWIFVSILIAAGIWQISHTKQVRCSKSFLIILLGFLILLIPLFFTEPDWRISSIPRFIAIAAMLLFLFSLYQFSYKEESRADLLYFILIGILIESIYAIYQFYFLKEGNWLGIYIAHNRPFGIFQKDSVLSSFLAIGLAIVFHLHLVYAKYLSLVRKVTCYILVISVCFLQFQIQSRAGIYSCVIVSLFLLPLLFLHDKKSASIIFVLLIVGAFIGWSQYHPARTDSSYLTTINFRILYWKHTWEMILQRPWLGHGYGSFEYDFLHDYYSSSKWTSGMPYKEENLDHPHNEILFLLFEGGIFAGVAIILLVAGYIISLITLKSWIRRVSLLGLTIPLVFHSMVEFPLYHSSIHFLLFAFFIWIASEESRVKFYTYSIHNFFAIRFVAILIPLITIPYMGSGIQELKILIDYERSKEKNIETLDQVVNPLPLFMLYSYDIQSFQLTFAMAFHDQKAIRNYIDWANHFLHVTPRAIVYNQLHYAYLSLGDSEKAKFVLDEGKRLFPTAKIWANTVSHN